MLSNVFVNGFFNCLLHFWQIEQLSATWIFNREKKEEEGIFGQCITEYWVNLNFSLNFPLPHQNASTLYVYRKIHPALYGSETA